MNITDIYVASPKMSENGSPVPAKNKIAVERQRSLRNAKAIRESAIDRYIDKFWKENCG